MNYHSFLSHTQRVAYTSELAEVLAPDVLQRFLRYVRIDTQSRRERTRSPSTPGQLELARLLVSELLEAGLEDAELDDNGYVFATLTASEGPDGGPRSEAPVIGLIALASVALTLITRLPRDRAGDPAVAQQTS